MQNFRAMGPSILSLESVKYCKFFTFHWAELNFEWHQKNLLCAEIVKDIGLKISQLLVTCRSYLCLKFQLIIFANTRENLF